MLVLNCLEMNKKPFGGEGEMPLAIFYGTKDKPGKYRGVSPRSSLLKAKLQKFGKYQNLSSGHTF